MFAKLKGAEQQIPRSVRSPTQLIVFRLELLLGMAEHRIIGVVVIVVRIIVRIIIGIVVPGTLCGGSGDSSFSCRIPINLENIGNNRLAVVQAVAFLPRGRDAFL